MGSNCSGHLSWSCSTVRQTGKASLLLPLHRFRSRTACSGSSEPTCFFVFCSFLGLHGTEHMLFEYFQVSQNRKNTKVGLFVSSLWPKTSKTPAGHPARSKEGQLFYGLSKTEGNQLLPCVRCRKNSNGFKKMSKKHLHELQSLWCVFQKHKSDFYIQKLEVHQKLLDTMRFYIKPSA